MNRKDCESCWQKVNKLWPSWKANTALYDAWMKRFADLHYNATIEAIDAHWEEHSKAFSPDPAAIVKLANRLHFTADTPEQTAYRERFHRMSKLNQARELRESYARRKKNADGEERDRLESLEIIAAGQIARLFTLHGEHCPPDFGPNTSRGAAPGTLFKDKEVRKFVEEKTP